MKRVDIMALLKACGVSYITEGKNVSPGNVNIQCPWCGDRDPSQHLGIHKQTGAYGCWREPSHRGRNPIRLIKMIRRCTWDEAKRFVEELDSGYTSSLDELRSRLESPDTPRDRDDFEQVRLSSELRPLTGRRFGAARFFAYLKSRRFDACDLQSVADRYELMYAVVGAWSDRLVFPIRREGRLLGLTGRAITPATIRYLSHPEGPQIKRLLFNEDRALESDRTLCITEGPIDSHKIDWYGHDVGVGAVALLGLRITDAQVSRIHEIAPRFDRVVLLLDSAAVATGLRMSSDLASCGVEAVRLPPCWDDPGAMTPCEIRTYAQSALF